MLGVLRSSVGMGHHLHGAAWRGVPYVQPGAEGGLRFHHQNAERSAGQISLQRNRHELFDDGRTLLRHAGVLRMASTREQQSFALSCRVNRFTF